MKSKIDYQNETLDKAFSELKDAIGEGGVVEFGDNKPYVVALHKDMPISCFVSKVMLNGGNVVFEIEALPFTDIHVTCVRKITEAVKEINKKKKPVLSPILKQFLDLKKKHPDALLLFRCGDFYETYMQDAEKSSKILGITLTKSSKSKDPDGKQLAMAGFPYHALDIYLPKLIRAGQRVAICDQIEEPKK